MKRILFVCHGNICRSPMAKFIMQKLVCDRGLQDEYVIDSAATSREELGADMYSMAKKILFDKGIPYSRHIARQFKASEYDDWDEIIVMDNYNLKNILRITDDKDGKIRLLNTKEVEDPWYTRNFEKVYTEIYEGCVNLLEK